MKTKAILAALALSVGMAKAATVTVTAGFGAQGLSVYNGPASLATNFYVAVGNYSGGSFTQFSTTIEDTGKVNGVFTAQAPVSLNGLPVHLWVGTGPIGAADTSFVILSANVGTAFPPDVAAAGGPTFNAALGSNLSVVTTSEGAVFDGAANSITLVPIPEPSVALLGALGVVGLMRRRR